MPNKEKILVIKLSALGDFIQTFGIMRAIREHHPESHITLLTTKPYASLGKKSPYTDSVIIDDRPKFYQTLKWFQLRQTFNNKKFNRVYDLQCNDRTSIYFKLFSTKPEWFGTTKGASHRNTSPTRKAGLAFYGHKQTLELADIKNIQIDEMQWMETDISKFNITKPYALIASGCAPTRPEKRWAAKHYGSLCRKLIKRGLQPVLLGTNDDKEATDEIVAICPEAVNLTGQTNLFDIAPLARQAAIAIGNDTGPMHFCGPTGCQTLTLFSGSSDPKRHKPLGDNVHTLQKDNINKLNVEEVSEKIDSILKF